MIFKSHSDTRRKAIIALALFAMSVEEVYTQDDSDSDEESTWTASAHGLYQNKDNSMGVDMSNDLAAFQYGVRIEHTSGFSIEIGAGNLIGSGGGFERWGGTLGYTYAAASWLNLTGEYSHFQYQNDSLNVIANLTNSLILGVTFLTSVANAGISYTSYFGGGSASYFAFNLDRTFQHSDLTINPSLNFSFISETIDQKRLVSYKKNVHAVSGKGMGGPSSALSSTSVTVTGLSGITLAIATSYDLGSGFSISVQPTYVYSPRVELAAITNEFVWSIGLTYSSDL